ncbi:tRNA 2-thiouridine(34) synthase MnmA [Mycoplasmopsis synoviae]|uniref:tRNA-specific 2-thiouridylase MnmA n=2 Tax=Mycoplasmopsis synoviae TaxID=2109 RepID=A0AAX3EYW5_MYCSY|nr:tRNA 2-thiouridine(34) synthase MnmA [Mycoplasmopsis synoviae]QGL44990.1 tRNA 2-thiouridine(34) synthase MnmA [Mycoplasmopsis synoviae]ULL02146.1 tRNA 2-thiouridine(34) synthase MnmA [Mycoplasmopsis synoviae]UZW64147.1 tRNA 2-thiouridine(34) synthase MnmA [Mycoplasmopsis synoviae]
MQNNKKTVVVGLSGGVDSSVAAYLLKKNYNVIGLFMRNWDSLINNDYLGNREINNDICPQELDYKDAQEIARQLDIPLYRVDFVKEYWDYVFENFISEYKKGRTPNPDILCNKYIKFDLFAKHAFNELKTDYIATGHYAKMKNGKLYRASDKNKDQSYFLSQLSKEQLKKVLFPLENLTKDEIRKIAREQNLITAAKKDSTGICFIGERKFAEFLQNYIPAKKGNVLDITNQKIVGEHSGCFYYTIGQRKGLNLGGNKESYYVCGKNVAENIIYVAPSSRPEFLESNSLLASNLNLNTNNFNKKNLSAKFRYRQEDSKVKVEFLENNFVKVYYDKAQAITPGQQVVFYDGEKCIGGAVIEEIYLNDQKLTYL